MAGDVRPTAKRVNSRLTQMSRAARAAVRAVPSRPCASGDMSRPDSPKSSGSTTVQPSSRTRRANPATAGVIPGNSAMTTTAGPVPERRTVCSTPAWSKASRVKSASASSLMAARSVLLVAGGGGVAEQAGQS